MNRFTVISVVGIAIFSFCGSALAHRLGMSGWDVWPVMGFAVGVVCASQGGLGALSNRIKALEDKLGSGKGTP